MARDVRLHEEGAVGVAVEIDLSQAQAPQDGLQVVRGVGGGEEVGGVYRRPPGTPVAALDRPGATGHEAREAGS